jgi:hypothetical protein
VPAVSGKRGGSEKPGAPARSQRREEVPERRQQAVQKPRARTCRRPYARRCCRNWRKPLQVTVDPPEVDADRAQEGVPAGSAEPARAQLAVAAWRLELLHRGFHVGSQRSPLFRQRLDSALPRLPEHVGFGEGEGAASVCAALGHTHCRERAPGAARGREFSLVVLCGGTARHLMARGTADVEEPGLVAVNPHRRLGGASADPGLHFQDAELTLPPVVLLAGIAGVGRAAASGS